jgi:hypothetical protein
MFTAASLLLVLVAVDVYIEVAVPQSELYEVAYQKYVRIQT